MTIKRSIPGQKTAVAYRITAAWPDLALQTMVEYTKPNVASPEKHCRSGVIDQID